MPPDRPHAHPAVTHGAAFPAASPAASPAPVTLGDSGAFPRISRASVIVGAHETPYLRLGRGAPALYLARATDGTTTPEWELVTALATARRVTLIEPPEGATDQPESPPASHGALPVPASVPPFSSWLAGLLDGLGIARVAIITVEAYALRVLHFALAHGDRVERLVLLTDDVPDDTLPLIAVVGTAPAVPLLILPSRSPDVAPPEASRTRYHAALMSFLAGDGDAATG